MLELIMVLIIDTGISSKHNKEFMPYISSYDEATHDHGPAVTGIVLAGVYGDDWVCPNVRVHVCHSGFDSNKGIEPYIKCLRDAASSNYDYVNISAYDYGYSYREERYIKEITNNSIVNVAAGNNSEDYRQGFPAGLKSGMKHNFNVIANTKNTSTNYGPDTIPLDGNNLMVYNKRGGRQKMSGTSMSAARYTHKLLKQKCEELYNLKTKEVNQCFL